MPHDQPPAGRGRSVARLQATFWPAARLPADGHLALWGPSDLESAARDLGLPVGGPATLPTVLPASPRARTRVATVDVPARLVGVLEAARALAALPTPGEWPPWQRPADSVLAWSVAAKLALEWVAAGRVVPGLRPAGPGVAAAFWRVAPPEDGRLADLARALPAAAHALRRDENDKAVWSPSDLLVAFCDAVADSCVRAASGHMGNSQGSPAPRGWPGGWAAALGGDDPLVAVPDTGDPVADVAAWAAPVTRRNGRAAARLCVRLDTPPAAVAPRGEGAAGTADGEDDPEAPWPLTYLLQATDDPSLVIPAEDVWSGSGSSLNVLGRRLGDPQESLVRGLAEAARLFPPLDRSLSEARPRGLHLSPAEAAGFLADGATLLAEAGLGVLVPAELTRSGARRLRARLRVGGGTGGPGAGITGAGLDAEALADFRWEVALGEEILTAEEFTEIVALKQPLVRWRGRWVGIDPEEAQRMAHLVGTGGRMARAEALAGALAGTADTPEAGTVEVVADGWLADLLTRLGGSGARRVEPRLDGVRATLRGYQRRGVAWLQQLADLNLGGVLADDMGLGKTLQTIAVLAERTAVGGSRPHLVVCPTSVVGNWERELTRFAPHLDVVRHHGPDRPTSVEEFAPGAVAVTSYGLMRRDADLLTAVDWDVVVLDEAQQVKNHTTRAARRARDLPAQVRLALTGTPVENRLSELWSIMDFANPALLGRFGTFKERYAVPVERWGDAEATARLRRLCAPFLLRRTKAEVATDLPPKHEVTTVCALTREQATLYQAAVDHAFDAGLGDGIDRRGRILALLTALKQICNHPAQYLGEPARPPGPGSVAVLTRRSGKLARATEMLAEVVAVGGRALVFTQYRAMGELLAEHLTGALGLREVPFLHGGVPRQTRDRMVGAFQSDPAASPLLLVSLKAGGTGLNLTAATTVLHYDRWWNPAVEDQATDRAHRIGQRRAVTVHKLVTAGTLEERIADLLERKRALADAVVGSGETWLTELADHELRDLVALDPAEIGETAATDDSVDDGAAA